MSTVTITLPVPTAYAVEPSAVVRYLVSHDWRCLNAADSVARWVYYESNDGHANVCLPRDWLAPYAGAVTSDAVADIAKAEGVEPHTLAALLASPTAPGPALQWAHASADTRAPVLALLDVPAAHHREAAARARERGDTERALYHDGRALGLEAAAAALRGGGL